MNWINHILSCDCQVYETARVGRLHSWVGSCGRYAVGSIASASVETNIGYALVDDDLVEFGFGEFGASVDKSGQGEVVYGS